MMTRLEKRRMKRNARIINFIKTLVIISISFLLINYLNAVNNTILELNCLNNSKLFFYDNDHNHLELFGKSYYLDLKYIK